MRQTIAAISQIPALTRKVDNCVAQCHESCRNNPLARTYGFVTAGLATEAPRKDISIDILGPLPAADRTQTPKPLLCIIGRCTRWVRPALLNVITGEALTNALKINWPARHPTPQTVLTGQGRQFTSKFFKTYALNTKYHITAAQRTTQQETVRQKE